MTNVLIGFCKNCGSDQERYKDGKCKTCISKRSKLKYEKTKQNAIACVVQVCDSVMVNAGYCSAHYHRKQRYGSPLGRPPFTLPRPKKSCSVNDCVRYSVCKNLCSAHYRRLKIFGNVKSNVPIIDGTWCTDKSVNRYKKITKKDHPLSGKDGRVLEHRYILFESIGPGWHGCNYCERMVNWFFNHTKDPDKALVVDHLDFNRRNNILGNLVPACTYCNSLRWQWKEEVVSNGQ